jgi:non-ribosomal peptide synthetase component F
MKNINSIVPLLPAQQLMLSATLKDKKELYVQQLLFEVNGYSKIEIEKALDKLIDSYECFRSLILYEGLKQAVWVSKDDVRPPFNSNQINFSELFEVIHVIRMKGFNFQKEPCIRFDWITAQEKNFLCITNHHILYDGWGKQVILTDFIRALKYPNSFLIEKLNKSWYEAWSKLDHAYAIDVYSKYMNHFDNFASISQISSLKQENLEHKTKVSVETIQQTSKNLGLTGAELINFCWSIFISSWTQNEHVQFGVVKQNGLIDQVKNGFGMGIQTLPFQFHVDFNATIREQIILFKNRERGISTASFVNSLDPLFSQFKYDFLIAFENYPIDSKLGLVENEFNLLFSYDRSEFPLSLAISPFPNRYELDWHYNTAFHNSNQIIFLANQFITFLESFELNIELSPSELCEKWYRDSNTIKSFKAEYNTDNFIQKLVSNLNKEQRKIHDHFSRHFKTAINCIWIYGDKHESMIPLISAAWSENVEVLTINEKESSSFVTKLLELKKPDLIFSSIEDYRFADSITLNQNLLGLNLKCDSEKMLNNNALSICTSGTTGEPKVVQLNIENIISFFLAWEEKLPWREKEYFAAIAHPAFDIGVAELMFPLWKGWEINLLNKSILSDSILLDQSLSGITAFHMVPSLLETWIEQTNSDEQERFIMTGGDKVPPHLYLKLHAKFPNSKLFQFYGPSECSVLASGFENQGQFEKNELPIGTAFNHAALFLFGNKSIPLPPYQEGEIIVSGPAVGVGYANEENSHKFFTFNEQPTFRTGDFGYKDAEGNLFFRGRKDRQLKINGQRIELSRIESALLEWSLLENWVVIPYENMLFAFAKASQKKHPERKKLEHLLPFYAIPQHIEILDEFPLNKNGKVDHQQLLNLGISAIKNIKLSGRINPEIETSIINLFQDKKLNFSIGWYANGLNSIDALKLAGILKTKLNLPIELNQILGTDNLFNLCQVKANSVNQDLNLTVIEAGQKVYSTAARLIFLSESDEQFHKSYWISSGVKIPVGFEIEQIKKWVNVQQNLHMCIAINQSEYYWKKVRFNSTNLMLKMNLNSFMKLKIHFRILELPYLTRSLANRKKKIT